MLTTMSEDGGRSGVDGSLKPAGVERVRAGAGTLQMGAGGRGPVRLGGTEGPEVGVVEDRCSRQESAH